MGFLTYDDSVSGFRCRSCHELVDAEADADGHEDGCTVPEHWGLIQHLDYDHGLSWGRQLDGTSYAAGWSLEDTHEYHDQLHANGTSDH